MAQILEVFWMNPIGQTFGLLGMISIIYAFLQADEKRVIIILLFSNLLWSGHFLFMEIYSGLTMTLIGAFRMGMTLKYKRNTRIFLSIFILTLVLGFYSYENSSSLLPIAGSLLGTYAFFYLDRIKLRLALLICSSFWFNYHYINFSIGGIINESLLQFVHVVMIYRLIVEQGGTRKYFYELKELFRVRTKVDYGRYVAITDLIKLRNKRYIHNLKLVLVKKAKIDFGRYISIIDVIKLRRKK